MASQTTMNAAPSIEEASTGVGANVANLTSDLVSLAELQGQLFMLDIRECGAKAARPAVAVGGGILLLSGAVPVLMAGLVWGLASRTTLPLEGACLLVAGVGFALAFIAIGYGLRKLQAASQVLARSRLELQENLRWIKKVAQQATNTVH